MTITYRGIIPLTTGSKRSRYVDPLFEATVYKHDNTVIELKSGRSNTRTGRVSSDLIGMGIGKSIGSPAGGYSLTAVPRELNYLENIDVGDWCELRGDNGDGQGMRRLMFGPVNQVRETKTADEKTGAVQTLNVIQGSDFGKVFAGTVPIYDAKLAASDPVFQDLQLAAVNTEVKTLIGRPSTLIRRLIEIYLGSQEQWYDPRTGYTFGVTKKTSNAITYVDSLFSYIVEDAKVLGSAFFEPTQITNSLWQTLQQWANLSVNELFLDDRPPISDQNDLVNVKPAVVFRQQPLWGTAWNELPSFEVAIDEVTASDLGKSDEDVRNWIRTLDEHRISGTNNILYGDGLGMINKESIRRLGFRRHEPSTPYIFPDKVTKPPVPQIDLVAAHSALQALWHHSNEKLISGTLATYFRPEARVGYRLNTVDNEGNKVNEYYIENMQHNLAYPGISRTTLGITRGRPVGDKLFQRTLQQLIDEEVLEALGQTVAVSVDKLAEVL